MKIDFVSDVSCPWCAIGLHSLERAIERLPEAMRPTSLRLQPFELNPAMGPSGQDIVEHLSAKYGIDAAQIERNAEAIRARGEAVGFTFGVGKRRRVHNTFDAHRLLHWAGLHDEAAQRRLKHALLSAYFTDGLDPSDRALLARLAGEAGLDESQAREMLASDRHADDVRRAEAHWQRLGIRAVPAVIVDDRHLIEGGQPPEVFEQALRRLAAAPAGSAADTRA